MIFSNKNEPYQEYVNRGYFEVAQEFESKRKVKNVAHNEDYTKGTSLHH